MTSARTPVAALIKNKKNLQKKYKYGIFFVTKKPQKKRFGGFVWVCLAHVSYHPMFVIGLLVTT